MGYICHERTFHGKAWVECVWSENIVVIDIVEVWLVSSACSCCLDGRIESIERYFQSFCYGDGLIGFEGAIRVATDDLLLTSETNIGSKSFEVDVGETEAHVFIV